MQGPLFQSVALTIWGNAGFPSTVSGLAPDLPMFPAEHSTLRACAGVRFITLRQTPAGWEEHPCAETPDHWLARLHDDGIRHLRLHRVDASDPFLTPEASAAAGAETLPPDLLHAERWLIEAVRPEGSDIWQARWHRAEPAEAGILPSSGQIWSVTYGRIATGFRPPPGDLIHPDRLAQAFSQTLRRCQDLAHRHDQAHAVTGFDLALRKLTSQTPEVGLPYPDLFPAALCTADTLRARQLLACAQTLWELSPGPGGPDSAATMTEDEVSDWSGLRAALRSLQNQAVLYAANLDLPPPAAAPRPGLRRRWWPFG